MRACLMPDVVSRVSGRAGRRDRNAPNMGRMKNVLWFVLGIVGGFVAAHFVNKDPRGHELLAEVDARISEFTERIGEAYRQQEAQIADLAVSARDAASDAIESTKDAVSDAVDDVKAAVTDND